MSPSDAGRGQGESGADPRGRGAVLTPAAGGALSISGSGPTNSGNRDATAEPRQSGMMPPARGGELEELAVCDLCGLVSALPAPSVCPACGGGYG